MYRALLLFCLFFLGACSPNSLEDFQYEGEAITKQIVKDLSSIKTRDDLVVFLPRLKKHFDRLADVIIQARQYEQAHPNQEMRVQFISNYDESLLQEMQRIYLIEGARVLVEKAQREAMLKLDAHERILQKQKEMILHPKR